MKDDTRTIGRLAVDTVDHVSKLLRSEMAVARAEFAEKVSEAIAGAAFIVIAGLLLIPVVVLLLMGLAAWLIELGLRPSMANCCAGVAGLVLAGVLALAGKSKLSAENLSPKHTLDEVARDKDAANRAL